MSKVLKKVRVRDARGFFKVLEKRKIRKEKVAADCNLSSVSIYKWQSNNRIPKSGPVRMFLKQLYGIEIAA